MRIDPKVLSPAISIETQKSQRAKPSEPPQNQSAPQNQSVSAASATSSDSGASSVVSLSPAATQIPLPQTASAAIEARLEKIRVALNGGQYPIDLDLLASRIVDDEALRSRKPS